MITLRNLQLRRGAKIVLDGVNVNVNPGEKVGLVGRNGAGKSSLFALLAGRLQADAGDFEIPARWRMGEVAQHMPETDDSATDFVLEGDIPLMEAQRELEAAEAAEDGHAMAEAHMKIGEVGGFDARSRAHALLMGLGFKVAQVEDPVNSFSGGWRMRLQLARALMCPADLLLLDEPTNHLDLDALVWLEAWLQRFEGTIVMISHDREFLDAITNVTIHLEDSALTRYGGNYSTFEEMRAERMSQQQAAHGRQQERVAQLQRFIDRFKAKASKAKQAQSRVKALARMERIAPVLTSADFSFEFKEPKSLPNPMLAMSNMEVGYLVQDDVDPDTEPTRKVIVRNINKSVLAGQRIGILGANGQGKSTLVKTISRSMPALGGEMTEGKGLSIGYFAQQEMDVVHADDTPLQHMVRLARTVGPEGREQELRDFLGQFRFVGDMVHQTIGTLSGGEKARLVLASLVWQRPNLLLMDEPTNHLDLTTREALSMALNEFEGTVLLVSHDRALLREVCDEFWLVSHGAVLPFDGDLDDYQKWLLETSRAISRGQPAPPLPGNLNDLLPGGSSASAPKATKAAAPKPAPLPATAAPVAPVSNTKSGAARNDDRKQSAQQRSQVAAQTRPLRGEVEQIDKRMEKLGAEKAELEASMATGKLAGPAIADAGRKLAHVGAEVAKLEERWLELTEKIEAMQSGG
ncbi:MAG: ATP-binding cassette domain-containing protein [Burkholderiaceae bacterium]